MKRSERSYNLSDLPLDLSLDQNPYPKSQPIDIPKQSSFSKKQYISTCSYKSQQCIC